MALKRVLSLAATLAIVVGGLWSGSGVAVVQAQADPCAGLPAYAQAMLAEEQRYTASIADILDIDDISAIANATPEQLTAIVIAIDQHMKTLDSIAPPPVAEVWHKAVAESGDLAQAFFADGALNGVFTVLVDYYDQSIRSDREIANAREAATAICPDFDAFATDIDMVDGALDDPPPGYAPWSGCEGLDDLGIAVERATLQAMVDVPASVGLILELGADWTEDPSIGWNQLQFFHLADYYEMVAQRLEAVTAPPYAAAWLQNMIDVDRAFAKLIRDSYGVGVVAYTSANGADFLAVDAQTAGTIAEASQTCPQFPQFVEAYG